MRLHQVFAEDGQKLAAFEMGKGSPLLFASGIGVHREGMRPLFERLATRYRLIGYDYRGMGDSVRGTDVPDMSVTRHARDGLAILDALGIGDFALAGWSMGVPVGVEILRRAPERVTAYSALFGAPGRPFDKGFPRPVGTVLETFFMGLRRVPKLSQIGLDAAVALPNLSFGLMAALEFVGRNAPRDFFDRQVRGVKETPKPAYFQAMLEMARHDGYDVLETIACPTLVVGGGKDWLTPEKTARAMADAIPNARLKIFPDATHFGVIEKADEIAALMV